MFRLGKKGPPRLVKEVWGSRLTKLRFSSSRSSGPACSSPFCSCTVRRSRRPGTRPSRRRS